MTPGYISKIKSPTGNEIPMFDVFLYLHLAEFIIEILIENAKIQLKLTKFYNRFNQKEYF